MAIMNHNTQAETAKHRPLSIPNRPYDDEFIRQHIYHSTAIHLKSDKACEPLEKRISDWFMKLPAWVQILLVEHKVRFEIGTHKELKMSRTAAADADTETYLIRHEIKDLRRFEENLSHEVGHVVDTIVADAKTIMGQPHKVPGSKERAEVWSKGDVSYRRALAHDRQLPYKRRKSDWRYGLKSWLSSDTYKAPDYPEESFAHLFDRYLTTYRQGKSEMEIDESMQEFFPRLWPRIRDHFLPIALDIAAESYEWRTRLEERTHLRHVDTLRDVAQQAADARGFLLDEHTASQLTMMATSQHYDSWVARLELLARPSLPKDPYKILMQTFPHHFETEEQLKEALNKTPALKREARRFALELEKTVEQAGISGLIASVHQMERSFMLNTAQKKERSR